MSWIHYLLCLEHIGPPRAAPKKLPKSEQPLFEVPELTFEPLGRPLARFGRVWVDLGTPLGGVRELSFRADFDQNSQILVQGVQTSPQASKMSPWGLQNDRNEPLGPPKLPKIDLPN